MTLSGPVDLTNGATDISVALAQVVLRDPNLYQTIIDGQVRFSGTAATGQTLSGRIDLGETEIRIPSTGLGGARAIPDITHVGNQRPPVRATRAKAGLEPYPTRPRATRACRAAGHAGRPPALDLVINAPNRVFNRGRGIDAELGGGFRIQGTARNAIPIGNLQLIRVGSTCWAVAST